MVNKIFRGFLLVLLAVLCAAGSALGLLCVGGASGSGDNKVTSGGVDPAVRSKYNMYLLNAVSDAMADIRATEKVYWLSDSDQVAPAPDPEKFGKATDPKELADILKNAEKLLDGETFYFNTDTPILKGSTIEYYFDDTILMIVWKENHDGTVYTFSEVKIAHPSQFRRFLAGGEYSSEKLFITTDMAKSVNAVVASSGDFFRFRRAGTIVYQGEVRRVHNGIADTCYIDGDGNMLFTRRSDSLTMEQAQQYVDENDIRFSLAFGPALVENGEMCMPTIYPLGEIVDGYCRSGLLQMGKLHYMFVIATGEGHYQRMPTLREFANRVYATGCVNAYTLDGGQTAVITVNGNKPVNRVTKGSQRNISDIIYFATAIPEGKE